MRGLVSIALAATLCRCVSVPEFDEPSIVDRPRVLAIVAEPPAVAPGDGSDLSLILAGFEGVGDYRVSWRVCGGFFSRIRGSQYGDQPGGGCTGGSLMTLDAGVRTHLRGEMTAALFDNLDVAAAVLGAVLAPETVELVREEVGLPLLMEATIRYQDPEVPDTVQVLRAVKRVLVTRGSPHGNPPPPHFDLAGQEVVVVPAEQAGDPFRCTAVGPTPPCVRSGAQVELAPRVPDDAEPWLEDYRVLNARGELEDRTERAFYGWFSTSGSFDQGVTKSPLRNELWRAPHEPGSYPLWQVVRDGHGGTSACRVEVIVVGRKLRCGQVFVRSAR